MADYGDHEEAMQRYCRDGEARALALGNRGPLCFGGDGKLLPAIAEAYERHGVYVFEGVISAEEIRRAIAEPLSVIIDAVKTTLDKCPPELAGDVMDRGIALTGGGALLRGLDERLREETGMPIHLTDNPLDSVALGTGKCVEDFDTLQQVLVPEARR